jgi:hypothetical protein
MIARFEHNHRHSVVLSVAKRDPDGGDAAFVGKFFRAAF